MKRFGSQNRAGFTIVEAAVSIVIVGVLLVASTRAFTAIAASRRIQVERREACMLGQQLMGEILQQYFQAPGTGTAFGPQPGQTRAMFTDVDQYNGYSASPPTTHAGAALSDYTGWSCSVAVAYVNPSNPAQTATSSTLKKVTVTVTAPSGKQYVLNGLRSPYGPYELMPPTPTNYLPGVGVTLQGASPGKTIVTNARPLNITTSQ
jgi:Tfp pilus assembly protein PilV